LWAGRPDMNDVEAAAPGLVADEGRVKVAIERRLHVASPQSQDAALELREQASTVGTAELVRFVRHRRDTARPAVASRRQRADFLSIISSGDEDQSPLRLGPWTAARFPTKIRRGGAMPRLMMH
jgi:hypothetical protein